MISYKNLFIAVLAVLVLNSCTAELRTATVKKEDTNAIEAKGKSILETAWKAQGMDKLKDHSVYTMKVTDQWKGALGAMGKLWPQMKQEMTMQYAIGTFDAKTTFTGEKRKGESAGLQSWKYYEVKDGKTEFMKTNKKHEFGLAAFQYFTELLDRLKNAPIIRYAGEKQKKGVLYDLVFVTWEKEKAHKQHDQYIIYINKETGVMDHVTYTLRDNYLKVPGYQMMYGTMTFSDYKEVDGIKIPFKQSVFAFGPKNEKRFLHQLIINDFKFDNFKKEELYPNREIKAIGDAKV